MAENSTPSAQLRMPAEWEPHEAVWLQWPHAAMRRTPGYARKLLSSWFEMTAILADHVHVRIAATNEDEAAGIVRDCTRFGANMARVEVHVIAIDDVWARDNGPIFVKRADDRLLVTDWNFNGWGLGGAIVEHDQKVPAAIANLMRLERRTGRLVTEGGALEVNGSGTLMATRSSILNPNRNAGVSPEEAEAALTELLGVTNFLWLSGAPPDVCLALGDATDFHVDLVARFVARNIVVANYTDDESNPCKPHMDRHISELRDSVDETGAALEVIMLPAPHMCSVSAVTFSGHATVAPGAPTDASYSNYLVTNGLILVPAYGRPEDKRARSILAEHFPGRDVVGISAIGMTEQGGAVHCVTQQQPAV